MKQNRKAAQMFVIPVFFLVIFFGLNNLFRHILNEIIIIPSVYAEDDEDGEEDDDYSAPAEASGTTETTTVKSVKAKPVYKTVYITKVITTLDPIFTTDTDKDGIVDGLDPHPTVPEKEYFTDDDNDGIANAFDTHPGEDDFAYYEQDNDTNGNGILDSYESLGNN